MNKDSPKDNLDSFTSEALQVCCDELIAQGNNNKSFEITKELILSCKLASKRYREDSEKKKESDQKIETSRKRNIFNDELLILKKKLDEVLMKKLKDDADKFIEQTAQDGVDMEKMRLLVVNLQSIKKSAKGKEKVIADINETIEKIGKELKALK